MWMHKNVANQECSKLSHVPSIHYGTGMIAANNDPFLDAKACIRILASKDQNRRIWPRANTYQTQLDLNLSFLNLLDL